MTERDNYRKFDELLGIIHDLSRPGLGVSYEYIVNDLGCSQKTAERMIKFLAEKFPDQFNETEDPLKKRRKLFHLDTSDLLPPDYIKASELVALSNAIKKIKDNTINRGLVELESKLGRMYEKSLQIRKTKKEKMETLSKMEQVVLFEASAQEPRIKFKAAPEVLEILRDAILECKVIYFDYHKTGESETYTIKAQPLGILYGAWNNYLIIKYRGKIQQQVLLNISNIKITQETFNPGDFSILEYAKNSFGSYHTPGGPFDVEWLVKPDAAKSALQYEFHPNQVIKKNKDGSLTVKFKGDGWREMSWYLFRWAGAIVPVKPQALVDEYKKLIKELSDSIK
jgi:predicted DNA-binding transcriptional regulator YafY